MDYTKGSVLNNLVTIITPSFQQAEYVEETIKSVLHQNLSALEYLIIDGESSDESVSIIKKYSNIISWWISEKDNGQSNAINKGLKKATGQVINWLNSDDYYESDALSIVLGHYKFGRTRAVFGRSRLFNEKGTIGYSRGTDVYSNNLPKTIGWARIDQPESFFLREAWDKVGLLNENLHYCMDREWWIRYLYHFGLEGIVQIPDVLVNFRIHDKSKTVAQKVGFLKEHHSLFYQMALAADEKATSIMISNNLEIDSDLRTNISSWSNKKLARDSFHYYLLKSANEFYAQDNVELCKEFLYCIDQDVLQPDDMKLFKKLKFRCKLPLSIVHFFRKK